MKERKISKFEKGERRKVFWRLNYFPFLYDVFNFIDDPNSDRFIQIDITLRFFFEKLFIRSKILKIYRESIISDTGTTIFFDKVDTGKSFKLNDLVIQLLTVHSNITIYFSEEKYGMLDVCDVIFKIVQTCQ